jgi:hypothetical protein
MRTIHKYQLQVVDNQSVIMPRGARIMTVQVQRGIPSLWAEVDDQAEVEQRTILTYGTGHPLWSELATYLGTYQIQNGDLAFHVFEKR